MSTATKRAKRVVMVDPSPPNYLPHPRSPPSPEASASPSPSPSSVGAATVVPDLVVADYSLDRQLAFARRCRRPWTAEETERFVRDLVTNDAGHLRSALLQVAQQRLPDAARPFVGRLAAALERTLDPEAVPSSCESAANRLPAVTYAGVVVVVIGVVAFTRSRAVFCRATLCSPQAVWAHCFGWCDLAEKRELLQTSRAFFEIARSPAAWPVVSHTHHRDLKSFVRLFPRAARHASTLRLASDVDLHLAEVLVQCCVATATATTTTPDTRSAFVPTIVRSGRVTVTVAPLLAPNRRVRTLMLRTTAFFGAEHADHVFRLFPCVTHLMVTLERHQQRTEVLSAAFRRLAHLQVCDVTGNEVGLSPATDGGSACLSLVATPATLVAYIYRHTSIMRLSVSPFVCRTYALRSLVLSAATRLLDDPRDWLPLLPALAKFVHPGYFGNDTTENESRRHGDDCRAEWYRAVALHPSLTHLEIHHIPDASVLSAATLSALSPSSLATAVAVQNAVAWPPRPNLVRLAVSQHIRPIHRDPYAPRVESPPALGYLAAFPNLECLTVATEHATPLIGDAFLRQVADSPAAVSSRLRYLGVVGQVAPWFVAPKVPLSRLSRPSLLLSDAATTAAAAAATTMWLQWNWEHALLVGPRLRGDSDGGSVDEKKNALSVPHLETTNSRHNCRVSTAFVPEALALRALLAQGCVVELNSALLCDTEEQPRVRSECPRSRCRCGTREIAWRLAPSDGDPSSLPKSCDLGSIYQCLYL